MKPFTPVETTELCEYGCNTIAHYAAQSGRKCCSSHFLKCPAKKPATHKHHKPYSTPINTTELCDFGCNTTAKYLFKNGKKCCSHHFNSCPGKRKNYGEQDHSARTAKSLKTRLRLGITKSSQIKATKTRIANGHYEKLAKLNKEHWKNNPWQNNTRCPILPFRGLALTYQGSYEFDFLESLEKQYGLNWVSQNVTRGPSIWYIDPTDQAKRLYLSDFLIGNTIYEIKSSWFWNKKETDSLLEIKNMAKLLTCKQLGYSVILVLDKKEISI